MDFLPSPLEEKKEEFVMPVIKKLESVPGAPLSGRGRVGSIIKANGNKGGN